MQFQLEEKLSNDPVEMRSVFCDTLMELAGQNRDIMVLDADLMGAMGTKPFAKAFPEQTVDCGIQEANMMGVAAGLSAAGKIPFAHTFAPFATRRACDQIFVSGAYAKLNVKIVGSDPGITAALNGGTHMPFEDMGIMRGIPTMTVLEPVDTVMLRDLMRQIAGVYGMHYMRLVRKTTVRVFHDGATFDIGRAVLLREGTDVTIIASGLRRGSAQGGGRAAGTGRQRPRTQHLHLEADRRAGNHRGGRADRRSRDCGKPQYHQRPGQRGVRDPVPKPARTPRDGRRTR